MIINKYKKLILVAKLEHAQNILKLTKDHYNSLTRSKSILMFLFDSQEHKHPDTVGYTDIF